MGLQVLLALIFVSAIYAKPAGQSDSQDCPVGCGRSSIGCDTRCPFGFPCFQNDDCLSGSCGSNFCNVGAPTSFGPVIPGGSTSNPPSSPPAGSNSGSSWSTGSIKSLADFGSLIKDSYGTANRQFVADPAGGSQTVLKVRYPAGSFKPSGSPLGGTGFYTKPLDLSKAQIATLRFKVFFPTGFDFVKGGKLPGLFGGHPSCSGGKSATDCFSTRFMFRKSGAGELYVYVDQSKQVPEFCRIPPLTLCNPNYGNSLGRGGFVFNTGRWTDISQTITLNTPGVNNGKFLVKADGIDAIKFDQVSWRSVSSVGFGGLDFETFFGGADSSWATPIEQFVFFKDFSITLA